MESLPSGELAWRDEAKLLEASPLLCGATGEPVLMPGLPGGGSRWKLASGSTLRTYRMAIATTGEFYAARGGNGSG